MQGFIFIFKDLNIAESIIKKLISEGFEFNFKIFDDSVSMNKIIDFKADIIFIQNKVSSISISELIANTNNETNDPQIIGISDKVNNKEENRYLSDGAFCYLHKDNIEKLIICIQRILEFSILKKKVRESKKEKNNYKKFRTLFEEAPDGVFLSDANRDIVDCNQAFCDLVNYSKEEALNLNVTDLLDGDNLESFKTSMPLLVKTGKVEGIIELTTKEGAKVIVRRSVSALYDDQGNYSGAIVQINDITEKEKYRVKIETSEEQLMTLINSSPDLIIIKDGEGKWLKANNAIINRLRLENIDFINKTNEEIALQKKDFKAYFNEIALTDEKTWENRGITIFEESGVSDDGSSISYEVTKTPVYHHDGSRKALIIIARDTTQRKRLESQLRHSQKMEAIGLLAGGIAHNFNNILQVVIGYVDFAKEGLEHNSQRYKDIDQINQHVKRAVVLTRNLMAVGKDQLMEKTELDINDIIQPIVDLTNRNKNNNITVKFTKQKNIPPLFADGSQIDQVIVNIFLNATEAMPDGGNITVDTSSVILDDDYCTTNTWAKVGSYIKTSITDTGQGMDDTIKGRIFEPYFTTKSLKNGIGLGLSTAFGIISQHNGLMNVISKVDEGTTFEIFLPISN